MSNFFGNMSVYMMTTLVEKGYWCDLVQELTGKVMKQGVE